MKFLATLPLMMSMIALPGVDTRVTHRQEPLRAHAMTLVGRWQLKFSFTNGGEKHLVLEAKADGVAAIHLLDTAPDDKPVAAPQRASWSQLTNDRVSFSSEVELPIGTCCREMGTVMFKGKFISAGSISGRVIFVTSVDEEESPYKFRTAVGTFTAIRE